MPNSGEESHAPALGSVSQESREVMRAFEEKFLKEDFYLGDGLRARSGLFDLGNKCFLRLYAVKAANGKPVEEKFMASLYRADQSGLLHDVEFDGLSDSFLYKGRKIPKLTTLEAVRSLIATTMALPQKAMLRGRVTTKLVGETFAPDVYDGRGALGLRPSAHDGRHQGRSVVHKIMNGLPFLEPN